MLTVGSLFSGIGGLDLGLERAGMKVIWQSEIDPYCNKVLKKHWPEVPNYGNIKEIDWQTIPRPNVICGGYPCQPFSTAGKRLGTDDPRHLWPWVRTAISELRPQYAILENVRGHLSMGGLQVIGELAEVGYDAEWRVVSAAGLGAPHRRDRVIIVAYPAGKCSNGGQPGSNNAQRAEKGLQKQIRASGTNVADAEGSSSGSAKPYDLCARIWQTTKLGKPNCSTRTDGDWWQVEPNVGRVANGVSARVDRLRGLGNAVVPQVAEYIGRLVMAAELNNS
jgi:DNA (cytosine-5)-methyltransferase 1